MSSSTDKPSSRPPLLLLVEDDDGTSAMMAEILRGAGLHVRTAHDAESGLHWLQQVTPDLVLVDLSLPGMDGATFVQAMRQRAKRPAPVVLCSALADCHLVAAQLGVAHVIEKPFLAEDLLRIVRRALDEAPRPDKRRYTRPPG